MEGARLCSERGTRPGTRPGTRSAAAGPLGWEFAGIVDAVGAAVSGFRTGDAVFAYPEFTSARALSRRSGDGVQFSRQAGAVASARCHCAIAFDVVVDLVGAGAQRRALAIAMP